MGIRIYGKVRKTIKGKQINPFWCDWRPGPGWTTVNITTASPEWGRALSPTHAGAGGYPGWNLPCAQRISRRPGSIPGVLVRGDPRECCGKAYR